MTDFSKNDIEKESQSINESNINKLEELNRNNNFSHNNKNIPTIFTSLEFSKNNMFFKSEPNKIAFDSLEIKNTGTTCIYYKWQKVCKNTTSYLPEKKGDGIDKFFCHYADNKLSPNESKKFTFSFFAERNGCFNEDWELYTSPLVKNTLLQVHLNGFCYKYENKYSTLVKKLDADMNSKAVKTMIEEIILDIIKTIKQSNPPEVNMRKKDDFIYYFNKLNKDYNVVYSSYVMNLFNKFVNKELIVFLNEINRLNNIPTENNVKTLSNINNNNNNLLTDNVMKTENSKLTTTTNNQYAKVFLNDNNLDNNNKNNETDNLYTYNNSIKNTITQNNDEYYIWNGSIDQINNWIKYILEKDKNKANELKFKLDCIIHLAKFKYAEDCEYYKNLRSIILDKISLELPDEINRIRDEYQYYPIVFDYYAKKSAMTEKDLEKINQELKKKQEEYNKKVKKKVFKVKEEEENELKNLKYSILSSISSLLFSKQKIDLLKLKILEQQIQNSVINNNDFDDDYINNFLGKIDLLKNTAVEQEICMLRIDLNLKDVVIKKSNNNKLSNADIDNGLDISDNKNNINNNLEGFINNYDDKYEIEFINNSEITFKSLETLCNNKSKLIVLIIDYGPKSGVYNEMYSTKYIKNYLLNYPSLEGISIEFDPDLEGLNYLNERLNEESPIPDKYANLKENSILILENINFNNEECGFETFCLSKKSNKNKEDSNSNINEHISNNNSNLNSIDYQNNKSIDKNTKLTKTNNKKESSFKVLNTENNINENAINNNDINNMDLKDEYNQTMRLSYFTNNKYVNKLRNKIKFYINDSIHSILFKYPTIIDALHEKRLLGTYLEDQLCKITNFFSIVTKNYLLIIGSNNSDSLSLDNNNYEECLKNLIILNNIIYKFKTVIILGRLGLMFLLLVQDKFTFGYEVLIPKEFVPLMKYILIKADLNNISILLPLDLRYIPIKEYKRFLGYDEDFYKREYCYSYYDTNLELLDYEKLYEKKKDSNHSSLIKDNDNSVQNKNQDEIEYNSESKSNIIKEKYINPENEDEYILKYKYKPDIRNYYNKDTKHNIESNLLNLEEIKKTNYEEILKELEIIKNKKNNNNIIDEDNENENNYLSNYKIPSLLNLQNDKINTYFKDNINYPEFNKDYLRKLKFKKEEEDNFFNNSAKDENDNSEEKENDVEDEEDINAKFIKLSYKEKERLKLFDLNPVILDDNSNNLKKFIELQNTKLPSKIFITRKQEYEFYRNVYLKPTIYCKNSLINSMNDLLNEEYINSINKEFNKDQLSKDKSQKDEPIEKTKKVSIKTLDNKLSANNLSKIKKVSTLNNSLSESKTNIKEDNINNSNLIPSPINPILLNSVVPKGYTISDFGPATYKLLEKNIKESNCIFWLGEISPSKIRNLYNDLGQIFDVLSKRKESCNLELNEVNKQNDKKLDPIKSKRYQLNIMLKSGLTYNYIKESKKKDMQNFQNQENDNEVEEDEEKLVAEINELIKYILDDKLDFVDSILKGENIPGLYGLTRNRNITVEEEELDLKFLDDIY